jgi:hypothetical protein
VGIANIFLKSIKTYLLAPFAITIYFQKVLDPVPEAQNATLNKILVLFDYYLESLTG